MAYEQLVSVPGSAPKNYVPTTDGLGGYSWAPQQGGGGGTTDHNQLTNRDAENQHPMSAITGLVKALEDKQPTGDYLTQDDLSGAVDDALTQAKESGAFDGADGVGIQSVEQTTTSTEDSGINVVTVTMTDGKTYTFNVRNGSKGSTGTQGEPGSAGTDGKSAYQYAVEGGYTGTEEEFAAKLAEEMPTKLPNPNALTFTGAVSGSYDGSEALSVEIPSGGGSAEKEWRLINTIALTDAVYVIDVLEDSDGNQLSLSDFLIYSPNDVIASDNTQLYINAVEPGAEQDKNGNYPWEIISSSTNNFLGTSAKSIAIRSTWNGMRYTEGTATTYNLNGVASSPNFIRVSSVYQNIGGLRLSLQSAKTFTAGTFYIYGR